jgi:hypothetical protein
MRTSDEIKAEIEKLKEEYKKARQNEKTGIQEDIVFIDGVGCVKKLPFPPNRNVYVLGMNNTLVRKRKDFYLCNTMSDKDYIDTIQRYSEHYPIIAEMPMRITWYNNNLVGKRVFETKEDAIAKLKSLLGENVEYEDMII